MSSFFYFIRSWLYRVKKRVSRILQRRASSYFEASDRAAFRRTVTQASIRPRFEALAACAPWGDLDPARELLRARLSPSDRDALLAAADRILAHEFDLLGSGPVNLGPVIDWHKDFKSGYGWDPDAHFTTVRWEKLPHGVDIKVPWELSRCQHFAPLGLAWWLTGERRYYDEFADQLDAWIAANPYARGVNWACPMDVALRAVSWLLGAMLFADCLAVESQERLRRWSEALWLHAAHIARNLEWNGPGTGANHLLADLTGLFTLGLFFRDTRRGKRWLVLAHRALEREMMRQVGEDGGDFEGSTAYHRLVLEMFLWCDGLARGAGRPFNARFRERLERMQRFIIACAKDNGRVAWIGDQDDGRVIADGLLAMDDMRYLGTPAEEGPFFPVRFLLDGTPAVHTTAPQGWSRFPRAGFWVHRLGQRHLLIRAGRHGFPTGGHAHCDQLSFCLSFGARDILVDRGAGCYTPDPERRNRLRSTQAHNVLSVNGMEQNDFDPAKLFAMPDHAQTEVVAVTETSFTARHYGFSREGRRIVHERTWMWEGEKDLEVRDALSGLDANDAVSGYWQVAGQLDVHLKHPTVRFSREGLPVAGLRISIGTDIKLDRVPHSPAYGRTHDAIRIQTVPRFQDERIVWKWEIA